MDEYRIHKKIAFVYDWADKWGGVERILLRLKQLYPDASWFTSYVDEQAAPWAKQFGFKTSFIQHLPFWVRKSRILSFVLYPLAFESFDMSSYDIVFSVTSSFAKGVITKPGTIHICYLLTPTRYLWSHHNDYLTFWKRCILFPLFSWMRKWDKVAAYRPDHIYSISHNVQKRCLTYYGRDSRVIYPGFNYEYWSRMKKISINATKDSQSLLDKYTLKGNSYYLVVSRIEPYKKVDLVVEAFHKMQDRKLIIVGKGSGLGKLVRASNNNILFIQNISDEQLAQLYTFARACIIPQEEDFGYVALEAQTCGCPLIAYKKGGVLETLISHPSHKYLMTQTVDELVKTVYEYDKIEANKRVDSRNVRKFSTNEFDNQIREIITNLSL